MSLTCIGAKSVATSRKKACFRDVATDFELSVRSHFTDSCETRLDVRVKRGADVASDHRLLTARLKLKLKKNKTETTANRQKYNMSLLRDAEKQGEFRLKLSNKFEVLQDLLEDENSIDSQWQHIKDALISTCQEVVGYRKFQQKEWISTETQQGIQTRKEKKALVTNSRTRASKAKAQEDYTNINRMVKRSIKADKRKYIFLGIQEMETWTVV